MQCTLHTRIHIVVSQSLYTHVSIHVFAGVIAQRAGFFGEGFGRVHLDNLNCSGSETRLQDCPHSAFEEVSCQSFESDVGIICPGMHSVLCEVNFGTVNFIIIMYTNVHVCVISYSKGVAKVKFLGAQFLLCGNIFTDEEFLLANVICRKISLA